MKRRHLLLMLICIVLLSAVPAIASGDSQPQSMPVDCYNDPVEPADGTLLAQRRGSSSYRSSGGSTNVRGYFRKDGTYVQPYRRTNPDRNPYNNYNMPGNFNPNTGTTTPGNPDTYLERYYEQQRR